MALLKGTTIGMEDCLNLLYMGFLVAFCGTECRLDGPTMDYLGPEGKILKFQIARKK